MNPHFIVTVIIATVIIITIGNLPKLVLGGGLTFFDQPVKSPLAQPLNPPFVPLTRMKPPKMLI